MTYTGLQTNLHIERGISTIFLRNKGIFKCDILITVIRHDKYDNVILYYICQKRYMENSILIYSEKNKQKYNYILFRKI